MHGVIREELISRVAAELQQFQLRRRQVRQRFSVHLMGTSKSHILLHIDSEPDITASELARVLRLEESTISRLVDSLILGKFLHKKVSSIDARKRVLAITGRGRDTLAELDRSQQVVLDETLKTLTEKERLELASLIDKLSERLGAEQVPSRPKDHPLTLALRKLLRGLGLTGDSLTDKRLPLSHAFILSSLLKSSGPVELKFVAQQMPFDPSTVSRTVHSLEEQKYLAISVSHTDRRASVCEITPNGAERFHKDQDQTALILTMGLQSFGDDKVERLLQLLVKANSGVKGDSDLLHANKVSIRRLTSEEDLKTAREILVRRLIEQDAMNQIPVTLFHPEGLGYTYEVNGEMKIVGAIHFDHGNWLFNNLATEKDYGLSPVLLTFIRHALQDFFDRSGAKNVSFPSTLPFRLPPIVTSQSVSQLDIR